MKFIVDKSSKCFQVISLFVFKMTFTASFNIILLFIEIDISSSIKRSYLWLSMVRFRQSPDYMQCCSTHCSMWLQYCQCLSQSEPQQVCKCILQIPNTVYTGHSWSLTQWIEPSTWKQRSYRKDTLLETKRKLPLV